MEAFNGYREWVVLTRFLKKLSIGFIQNHERNEMSDGIRQSPRGDRLMVPTFGPSGKVDRLYCWEANLFKNTESQWRISSTLHGLSNFALSAKKTIFWAEAP
jgi:hypothetical protein